MNMWAVMQGLLVGLALCGCNRASPSDWTGTSQVCSVRRRASTAPVDMVLVIDDSAHMAAAQTRLATEMPRLVDDLLTSEESPTSYRFGVISAEPNAGPRLRTGCGIVGDRPFIEYQRGVVSNLEPGTSVGKALGCLATVGTSGPDAQQPATTAAHFLTGNLLENGLFRRSAASTMVVFFVGADHDEDLQPWRDAVGAEHDLYLEAVSPPSTHMVEVLATKPLSQFVALDATVWPKFEPSIITETRPNPCLLSPPRDPSHPSVVVEDWTLDAAGERIVTEIPACAGAHWQPTCWTLVTDPACVQLAPAAQGLNIEILRPAGVPTGTVSTMITYECALGT